MSLRDLQGIQSVYVLPRDSLVTGVLIPCLSRADECRCMMGFFTSSSLRDLAPGLAEFLGRSGRHSMRLLVSPHVSKDDHDAIAAGITNPPDVLARRLEDLVGEAGITGRALVRHTLECLAYLIAAGRLEIRVTLIRGGLFHPKVWLFRTATDLMAAHGSSNMTASGLTVNLEHISVARSWIDATQAEIAEVLSEEFDALWRGQREYALTVDLPRAVKDRILSVYTPASPPTSAEMWGAWEADYRRGRDTVPPGHATESDDAVQLVHSRFGIPPELNFETGDFAHQGQAVTAWESAGRRGILEMATGAGKTITALVAAHRLCVERGKLLLLIAAPYLPLISQWAEEAKFFGLAAVIPGAQASQGAKHAEVERVVRLLNLGLSDVECVVVTHDYLCDATFQGIVSKCLGPILLIGDEVHNLGRSSFLMSPPEFVAHRIGLSATPERQYDDEGTAALKAYFGEVVFSFGLADAIGKCLVPYDYYVHPIELSPDEFDEWLALTDQLTRLGWTSAGDGDGMPERLRLLLIRRRKVLEEAAGKMAMLRNLLVVAGSRTLHHTLIYCTDKGPDQLVAVNALLSELGVLYHQLTSEETAQPRLSGELLRSFTRGDLQVLTAKRVLDEGVNIPEIGTAFILASTTVERQWIQRRGRVLRKCGTIAKSSATIHDFLVVPPEDTQGRDREARKLVSQELRRVMEFARLARNAAARGGPLETVQPLIARWYVGTEHQALEQED